MDVIKVIAKPRQEKGGGAGRQLRAQKRIPAILYGNKQEPVCLSLDLRRLEKDLMHLHGENVMIDLSIEGREGQQRVFLRDIQRDPVTDFFIHVDLLRIDENQKMNFHVPVHHVGNCEGVKLGGILDQHLRTIHIQCLPKELPSHIDVDVSDLLIHQSLHIRDIVVPETLEILNPPSDVVFTVLAARKPEVEIEAAEGEEEAEPEVIGEKETEKGTEKGTEKEKEKEKEKKEEKR